MNILKRFTLKNIFVPLCAMLLWNASAKAQTPTTCLEIESILVDACGSPEGQNEMVRFKVGPAAIATSNLSVNWPSNSFLGISAVNATTTNIVTTWNSTILGCGWLLEPTGGMLPAGKSVLLVTSTAVSLTANSFANLTDTLYVIFQNAGNTAGHFANYSMPSGLRTLSISRISPACTDAVSYDKVLLINQSGGHGGSATLNDGATVEFSWAGVASYVNNGCQAPFVENTASAGPNATMCASGTLALNGTATGNYSGVTWSGGAGSFSDPNILNPVYTAAPSETGSITLTLGVIGHCSDTVFSSLTVTISPAPTATITASGSTSFCVGGNVTLSASGGSSYLWSTGATTPSINVSTPGTYTVTATNSCGSQTATQTVTVDPAPSATITAGGSTSFCAGGSVTLYASGLGTYSWSTGAAADSIVVTTAGTYTLTSTNGCGSQTATQTVTVNPLPTASISASGSTSICAGDAVTLTAAGTGSYLWSTGATTASISVSAAGTYTLTSTNSCGSQTATITVTVITTPTVTISSGATSFCSGSSLLLYATGTGTFSWTGGSTNDSIYVTSGGTYSVSAGSSCGTATDNITVTEIPLPVATISASGTTALCPGNSVTFTGSGGTSYTWLPSGSSGSTFTTGSAGTYTLTATNSCGSSSATMSVTALSSPNAIVSAAGSTTICAGDNVSLTAAGGSSYLWSTGQTGTSISASAEGNYWVIAGNSCGSDSAFIYVNVDSVTALFTANPITGQAPLNVNFSNGSSASATGFLWDLGDGSFASVASPSNTYTVPGTYPVVLTATNAAGCTDTYSLTIIVQDEVLPSALAMPNVFTPNNDRVNDDFRAIGYNVDTFSCRIYDRWGILVSELTAFNSGWDGRTTSGEEASDGTYFYVLKASARDGKTYDLKGYLQLIRK